MIQKLNNLIIDGSAGKLIFIDATFKANVQAKQVVFSVMAIKDLQ
jgi:hypothetical protein